MTFHKTAWHTFVVDRWLYSAGRILYRLSRLQTEMAAHWIPLTAKVQTGLDTGAVRAQIHPNKELAIQSLQI